MINDIPKSKGLKLRLLLASIIIAKVPPHGIFLALIKFTSIWHLMHNNSQLIHQSNNSIMSNVGEGLKHEWGALIGVLTTMY